MSTRIVFSILLVFSKICSVLIDLPPNKTLALKRMYKTIKIIKKNASMTMVIFQAWLLEFNEKYKS
jgi:hypothetical protein